MNLSKIQPLPRDQVIARSKTIPARHFEYFADHGMDFMLDQLGFDAQAVVTPGLEELGIPIRNVETILRPDQR